MRPVCSQRVRLLDAGHRGRRSCPRTSTRGPWRRPRPGVGAGRVGGQLPAPRWTAWRGANPATT
eukprot:5924065-Alexandrium_andersonii.AAC.1